jgi:inner membrane protein involved in colicin E2 resistance
MSIWFFLLSWLIRQVENGIGDGGDEPEEEEEEEEEEEGGSENETTSEGIDEDEPIGIEPMTEVEPYEPITQAIKIAIAVFSLLLLGLSISAYKKTALKRLLYAAVAFGLFAIQMFFDYLEDAVEGFDTAYSDIIFFGITLAILVFFFIAIVRKQ